MPGCRLALQLQETRPKIHWSEFKISRKRLPDIGEGLALTQRPGFDAGSVSQYRNMLTGVIGALPGRIAAVVGADNQDIVVLHQREHFRQPLVYRQAGAVTSTFLESGRENAP